MEQMTLGLPCHLALSSTFAAACLLAVVVTEEARQALLGEAVALIPKDSDPTPSMKWRSFDRKPMVKSTWPEARVNRRDPENR